MSDEEMSEDYPDFDRIKSSPSTSPLSLPSRENSVILEARDVHQLGKLPCISLLIYLVTESSKQSGSQVVVGNSFVWGMQCCFLN